MVNCAVCGKEFKNRRGFKSHMRKHKEEENKPKTSSYLAELLMGPAPLPIHRVDIDMSPGGHLKISIKKELLTKEELYR